MKLYVLLGVLCLVSTAISTITRETTSEWLNDTVTAANGDFKDDSASHFSTAVHSFKNISDRLLECPAVKYKMPPSIQHPDPRIYTDAIPFQIIYVDELQQSVTVSCFLGISWFQRGCEWDPEEYSGIDTLDIDSSKIWTPEVMLPKSSEKFTLKMPDSFSIDAHGAVTKIWGQQLQTNCFLDLTWYPIDQHNCSLTFLESKGSIIQHHDFFGDELNGSSSFFSNFHTSTEWDIQESGCKTIQQQEENFLECWFTIKRKSSFYVATVIIPILFMSGMTLLVFYIPSESGEKLSFVISLFLSMTVFINFVVTFIPRSMDGLPKIVKLILAIVSKIALATMATILVLRKYNQEQNKRQKGGVTNKQHLDDSFVNTPTRMESLMAKETELDLVRKRRFVLFRSNKIATHISDDKGSHQIVNDFSDIERPKSIILLTFFNSLSSEQLDRLFFWGFMVATAIVYPCIYFL